MIMQQKSLLEQLKTTEAQKTQANEDTLHRSDSSRV